MKKTIDKLDILLIEDNPGDVRIIREVLHELPELNLVNVNCISAAIEYFDEDKTDLVILDLGLPESQGLDTVRTVVALIPSIPIIVLTGLKDDKLALDAIKTGAQDYLAKGTLDPEILRRSIHYSIERKRLELALRGSQANLQALTENTEDRIWSVDKQFCLLTGNSVFHEHIRQHFGKKIETGENTLELGANSEASEVWKNYYIRALKGERFNIIKEVRFSEEVRFFDYVFNPIFTPDGTITGTVVSGRDITERLQSAETLFKLRSAIDASGEVVFMTDTEGIFTFINPAFTALYGYTSAEVTGKVTPRILNSSPKEDLQYERFWKILMSGEEVKREFINKAKDGRLINIEGSATPVFTDDNKIIGYLAIQRDITGRKLAENDLFASRAELKAIYDFSPVMMCVMDTAQNILYANPAFTAFTGVSENDLKGKHANGMFVCINALDDPRGCGFGSNCPSCALRHAIENTLKTGTGHHNVEYNTSFVREKETRDIALLASTALIHMGDRDELLVCLHDITERKLAEEALNESNNKIRSLAENMPGNVAYVNADSLQYEFVNDMFVKSYGIPREKIIGRHVLEIDGETNHQFALKYIEQVKSGKVISYENTFDFIYGKRWVQVDYAPVFDASGHVASIVMVSFDITERKQSEEKLKVSEEKFRSIYKNAQEGIFQTNINGTYRSVNPAFAKMLGFDSPEEYIKYRTDISRDSYYDPKERERFLSMMEEHGFVKGYEYEGKYKDGSKRWFYEDAHAVKDVNGKIQFFEGFIIDITDRKRAEEALRESEQLLRESQVIADLGHYSLDIPSGLWKSSEMLDKVFGIDEGYDYTVEGWLCLVHPEDRPMMADHFNTEVLGQGRAFNKEYRIIRPNDQAERWVHGMGKLEFDANGSPLKMNGIIQDITESKIKENAIRENEEKYRSIVQWAPVGIYQTTRDGKFLSVNQRLAEILGYKSIIDLQARNLETDIYVTPSDRHMGIANFEPSSYIFNHELRWKKKNGTPIWISLSAHAVKDQAGVTQYFEGFVSDITERKQVEEALHNSEEKFRAISEQTVDLIAITDHNGFLTYASPASKSIFYFTPEEMCGHNFTEFLDETSVSIAKFAFRGAQKYGEITKNLELSMKRKDGSVFIGELCGSGFNIGAKNGTLVVIRDITLRKQAEEELRSTQQLIEGIMNAIPTRVFWKDRNLNYLGCNKAFALDAGFSDPMEIIGKNDYQMGWHDQAELYRADDRQVIESGSAKLHIEEPQTTPEGRRITLLTTKIPLLNSGGEVTGILGTYMDITERKLMELAVQQAEVKYRGLFMNANDAIFLMSDDTFIDCNPKTLQMFGCTMEDILGHKPFEFSPSLQPDGGDSEKKALDKINRAISGVPQFFEWMHKKHDGTLFDVEVNLNCIDFDGRLLLQAIVRDITERKRTELALLKSEEKFRTITEQTPDLISIADANGLITYASPASLSLFQYAPEEMIGRNFTELVDSPDIPRAIDEFGKALEYGEISKNLEISLKRKDGSLFTGELNGSVFRSGTQKGSLVIIHDITQRKQAEEKISMLAHAIRSIGESVSITDLENNLLFVNRTFLTMYQYEEQELLGNNISMIVSPNNSPGVLQKILDVTLTGGWQGELLDRRKDGSEFPVFLSTSVIQDENNRPFALIGVATDITERKKAEGLLKKSISRYNLLSENMRDVVWLMDLSLKITYISPSIEKARGFSFEELERMPVEDNMTPDSYQVAMTAFKEEITKLEKDPNYSINRTLEIEFYRKDGSTLWLENTFTVIRDENGLPVSILGEGREITERRHIQEQLKQLNVELEQRVADRTAELQATNRELEAFSYSVSHDLRAPLRAIDGFTSILMEDYEPGFDEEGKKLCGRIKENTQRMGQLIDDLLAFSRLGRRDITMTRINMKDLANSVYKELTTVEMRRKIDFHLGDLGPVSGDRTLLYQVWSNLIANALKFSSHCKRTEINITGIREKNRIVFCIKDKGAGFDMKYSDKLFGVFQRLHSVKEFEGTGVGLAIVQRIINRHGGEVWAEGETGKGATFYFSLPVGKNQTHEPS